MFRVVCCIVIFWRFGVNCWKELNTADSINLVYNGNYVHRGRMNEYCRIKVVCCTGQCLWCWTVWERRTVPWNPWPQTGWPTSYSGGILGGYWTPYCTCCCTLTLPGKGYTCMNKYRSKKTDQMLVMFAIISGYSQVCFLPLINIYVHDHVRNIIWWNQMYQWV